MKRAATNHWVILSAAVVAADLVPFILFLRISTPLAIGITFAFAVALFPLAYVLTCTPRWWILPLAGSPLIVIPLLVGILFFLAIVGIVPVP